MPQVYRGSVLARGLVVVGYIGHPARVQVGQLAAASTILQAATTTLELPATTTANARADLLGFNTRQWDPTSCWARTGARWQQGAPLPKPASRSNVPA